MAEKGANIDLVFRNGLKDYEVLPPQDVLDNILPAIKPKPRSFIYLKSAAMIATVLTLGFITYQLTREASVEINASEMAFNIETTSPAIISEVAKANSIPSNSIPVIRKSSEPKTEIIIDESVVSDTETITPQETAYLQEANALLTSNSKGENGPSLATLNGSKANSFKIPEPVIQYFPENIPVKGAQRWSVAAMASPTYYSQLNSGNSAVTKQLLSTEKPLISYAGGVAFSYKVNRRFSIQSGLYFSSLGQVIDGVNSFTGFEKYNNLTKGDHNFEVLTSAGIVYTKNPDVYIIASGPMDRVTTNFVNVFDPKKSNLQYINSTLRQNFSYLELPVMMRYKILDKALDLNVVGGMSYNLLVNNSVYTFTDGRKYVVGETEGLNMITVSSSLGMGLEYSVSEKFSLNIEPTLRYYLNPFSNSSNPEVHSYSFGIFSGVSYKF